MEILSPVGGSEQLIAAVRSGANAVYLGTKNFNARRNADNFDDQALKSAIEYCHARNVKVYVTLNTLITDKEIKIASQEIENIAKAGADAVIVQDLGVLKLIRNIVPDMPVHASTQMTVHNAEGAEILEQLGFTRVVPARELSFDELKKLRDCTSLELEVFVHGALCMSVSGQCYLSSVLGQRSANRGLCAQPCRLDFKSQNGNYALSLKDLSVIKDLNKLQVIGINSAKIEGRMKRPEYVAAATAACKNALENKQFDADTLKAVFSRSGFTDAYLTGKRNRELFGYRTKEDVISATPVLKQIANSYRKEIPLVAVDMDISIKSDKNVILTVSDGVNTITETTAVPQIAVNRSIDESLIRRSLEKCGGTPFYLQNLNCDIDNGLTVSMSELNSLRKNALDNLEHVRGKSRKYRINNYIPQLKSDFTTKKQLLYARYENVNQICDETDYIILDYEAILNTSWLCEKYGKRLIAELPALMFDTSKAEEKLLNLKKMGIQTVYVQNLYAISLAKRLEFKILGGFKLNIINSLALSEYSALGVNATEITFESTIEMFERMDKCIPCGLIVYGKMPLMTFRACPVKTENGCANCTGLTKITDRYGNEMTVICKNKQYSKLLNPYPIYMGDKKYQLKNADFLTLYFTDETHDECKKIISNIKLGAPANGEFTRGLYYKEIK